MSFLIEKHQESTRYFHEKVLDWPLKFQSWNKTAKKWKSDGLKEQTFGRLESQVEMFSDCPVYMRNDRPLSSWDFSNDRVSSTIHVYQKKVFLTICSIHKRSRQTWRLLILSKATDCFNFRGPSTLISKERTFFDI